MRVVAGKLRHRIIQMTNLETTRETQDKVRGAIFNMIGPYFDGGVALDLFAGSGAMGIEAYSRGIDEIHLNDIEPQAIRICKENCSSLGIKEAFFTTQDYKVFVENPKCQYDLVFLDPPYRMNEIEAILTDVEPIVKPSGQIVFELSKESKYPTSLHSLNLHKDKVYGIKRVIIYKKEGDMLEE